MAGARVPNVVVQVPGLVVEYSNQPEVSAPLAIADPFRFPDVAVTVVAAFVVATGGPLVVKDSTEP